MIWTPKNSTILWRILGLLLLSVLWLKSNDSEGGVVLLLFLIMMTLIRWRFSLPSWTVVMDQAACLITVPFWPNASYGLALALFEVMIQGKPWLMIPGITWIILYDLISIPLSILLLQSGLSGWMIRSWTIERNLYRQEADQQRRDRYELEELKGELILANAQVARMAEISERNRIAQKLHDDVGHEITAAILALQAFEQLWKEEDKVAEEMFLKAKERLFNSSLYLRETVHNMKPVQAMGVGRLQDICNGFTACPVDFQIYGDTARIPIYLWSILEPCLKEALTNVVRHSEATKVEISLDVTPNIVRLYIYNDGIKDVQTAGGTGLRNLRHRAQAVGGSISIDSRNGFRLICVLPMNEGSFEI